MPSLLLGPASVGPPRLITDTAPHPQTAGGPHTAHAHGNVPGTEASTRLPGPQYHHVTRISRGGGMLCYLGTCLLDPEEIVPPGAGQALEIAIYPPLSIPFPGKPASPAPTSPGSHPWHHCPLALITPAQAQPLQPRAGVVQTSQPSTCCRCLACSLSETTSSLSPTLSPGPLCLLTGSGPAQHGLLPPPLRN